MHSETKCRAYFVKPELKIKRCTKLLLNSASVLRNVDEFRQKTGTLPLTTPASTMPSAVAVYRSTCDRDNEYLCHWYCKRNFKRIFLFVLYSGVIKSNKDSTLSYITSCSQKNCNNRAYLSATVKTDSSK